MATNGHDAICQRGTCAELPQHKGGEHLDPNSKMWDGPDNVIAGLSNARGLRGAAKRIRELASPVYQHDMDVAVHDLAREILRLDDLVTHVRVDADRKVRQAADAALDCEQHGKVIADLEQQVHGIDVSNGREYRGRVALLHNLKPIEDGLRVLRGKAQRGEEIPPAAELIDDIIAALERVNAAHGRAWKS